MKTAPSLHRFTRLLVAAGLLSLASACAAQQADLLKNEDLAAGEGRKVPGWEFSTWNFRNNPGLADQLDWKVADDAGHAGSRCLTISTLSAAKANVWWQQVIPATPGASYRFSVKLRGKLGEAKYGRPGVGIYFIDASGKWLGFQEIKNLNFSGNGEWQSAEEKVTAPEDAAKMAVRLGAMFDGSLEVSFKEIRLTALDQ